MISVRVSRPNSPEYQSVDWACVKLRGYPYRKGLPQSHDLRLPRRGSSLGQAVSGAFGLATALQPATCGRGQGVAAREG